MVVHALACAWFLVGKTLSSDGQAAWQMGTWSRGQVRAHSSSPLGDAVKEHINVSSSRWRAGLT